MKTHTNPCLFRSFALRCLLPVACLQALATTAHAQPIKPGAIYFNGWGNSNHHTWINDGTLVKTYPERTPSWGYPSNSTAYMEQEINAAVNTGGLQFFAFLYYPTTGTTNGIDKHLTDPKNACFPNYFNASNRQSIEWCLYLSNHSPYQPTSAFWLTVIDSFFDRGFFTDSKYLKVNGKPVIIVYDSANFTAEARTHLRNRIAAAGFPGCYIIPRGPSGGSGWDGHTMYNIQAGNNERTQADMRADNINFLNTATTADPVLAFAGNGWDNRPWCNGTSTNYVRHYVGRTPNEFATNIASVKAWMTDPNNAGTFIPELMLISAWNENGEGGYLIPSISEGSDHLKALKMALNTTAGAQVFRQDFNRQHSTAPFVSATPNTGQFNDISAESGGGTWTVLSARLQLTRTGNTSSSNGAGLTRTTSFAGSPTTLAMKFDFSVDANQWQSGAMTVDIGKITSVTDYNNTTPDADTFARLMINLNGSNTFKFQLNGTTSQAVYSANGTMHSVSAYLNKSGSAKSYLTPTGVIRSLNNNSIDLWIGTTLLFGNAPALNSTTSNLNNLRMRFASGDTGTWKLDNFLVHNALPTTTSHFTPIAPVYPISVGVRKEAETLGKGSTYVNETSTGASGGARVKLTTTDEKGAIWGTFAGNDGTYTVEVRYFDESVGSSASELHVNGKVIGSWIWNANNNAYATKTFSNVAIKKGDVVKVISHALDGETVRIDYLNVY